jgi:hypothetical protein
MKFVRIVQHDDESQVRDRGIDCVSCSDNHDRVGLEPPQVVGVALTRCLLGIKTTDKLLTHGLDEEFVQEGNIPPIGNTHHHTLSPGEHC